MGRCANLAIRDVVVEVQRERCSVALGSHLGAQRAEEGVAARVTTVPRGVTGSEEGAP
jgi:hypothetical protein